MRKDTVARARLPGLDVGRLLAGLQRGSVPGANDNVGFLCEKFSSLLDRLHLAESGDQECEDRCRVLELKIRAEHTEQQADQVELETVAGAASSEQNKLKDSLSEVRREEADMNEELQRARGEAESLMQQRSVLEDKCAQEQGRLNEANLRVRQLKMSTGGDDLRKMEGQVQALSLQYTSTAEALQQCRDDALRDDARLTKLRAEILGEEEAREHASLEASAQREELNDTSSDLGRLKEGLTEVQVALQTCEDQLQRRSERGHALRAELQRRELWLVSATQRLESFQGVDLGCERVLTDTAEVSAVIAFEEVESREVEAATRVKAWEICDSELRCRENDQRLQEVLNDRGVVRARRNTTQDEHAELERNVEQLRHDQAAGGGMRSNLEKEMELLFAEADAFRQERADKLVDHAEMQHKLQWMTPSLSEARRRLHELEDGLEAAQGAATKEQQQTDRLERETTVCQEKMRALREQNVRLSEQVTQMEAQLAQSASSLTRRPSSNSRIVPGAARRVGGRPLSAAMARASSSPRCLLAPPKAIVDEVEARGPSPFQTTTPALRPTPPLPGWGETPDNRSGNVSYRALRTGSDDGKSPNLSHWPSHPGSEAADSVDEPGGCVVPSEHLSYLRHWISKEDERLGAPPSRAR